MTREMLASEQKKLDAVVGADVKSMEQRTAIQARMQAMRSVVTP